MKNFVNVDTRFQKSINLTLDTGDMALVNRYIPTRSSVSILKQYLTNIVRGQGEHATILIGPYGKGKSHLLFLDEAWFEDSEVLDYMEVWYWSAILSGEFKIEQNRAFIRNLQNVLSEIQNIKESDKKFTKALCNNVLTDKKFADRDIVLMKNPSVYPEEVIGNTICQFYLSETYSDILKPLPEKNDYQPQTLSALNNSVKLQKHHIMPIGSLSVKYKDANKTTESRRKDNSSPYNSPLNFLLISEKANGLIQNSTLKEYFEFCDQTALNNVDIKDHTFTDMSKQEIGYRIGDEALQIFLEKRYDDFKSRITSKCRNLLNCPDICCGEGGN